MTAPVRPVREAWLATRWTCDLVERRFPATRNMHRMLLSGDNNCEQ